MDKLLQRCITVICAISLLISCNRDEYKEDAYNSDQLPLHIFPTVGEDFTRTTVANGSYQFSDQDAIGVFAVKSGEVPSSSDKVYNQKYTYNGNNWNTQSDNVYWPNGELGTACVLYGYYPYTQDVSDPQKYSFTLKTDQTTVEKMYANDFLYVKKTVNKENTAVILNMSHLFSMVTINIKYEEVGDICTDISLTAKHTANINLLNGEVISNGNAEVITPALLDQASNGYSKSYSAIISPQKIDNSVSFISLLVDGTSKSISINRNFIAGKHYSVNLTVSTDKVISLQGIYISQWDEQITITNGSKDETIIYNTGDVIEYQKKRDISPATIIITGDGFLKEHMLKGGLFEQYATKAIEFIFDVEPYKSYRNYFNVYFIPAVSNQTKIGNSSETGDTYFRTRWDDFTDRLNNLDSNILYNFIENYCPDIKEHKTDIKKVKTLVLVNDQRADGITWSWSDGKGYALSTLPEGLYEWSNPNADKAGVNIGDWRSIVLHEFGGHAFGRLVDEYWYETTRFVVVGGGIGEIQNWSTPMGKNVADNISENSNTCYWRHLIGDPHFPKIGYFEGAYLSQKGFWRCEEASCMIDNRRYFNAYSRQLIVERIMNISGEPFSFEKFMAKDVNYDEILDSKPGNSRILKGHFSDSEIKKAKPLSPPVLINID